VKDLDAADPRVRELVAPPVSEEELLRMGREEGSDAEFRAHMRARWSEEAIRRYRRISRG